MVAFIIASTVVNTRPRYSSGTCVSSIVRFSTLLQPIGSPRQRDKEQRVPQIADAEQHVRRAMNRKPIHTACL